MKAPTHTPLNKRLEEIKSLIVTGQPYEKALYALYTALAKAGQYKQAAAAYRFALLYVPAHQQNNLFHPSLLQAFLSLGHITLTKRAARALLAQHPQDPETQKLLKALQARTAAALPPYTPLAAVSPYAGQKPLHTHGGVPGKVPAKWRNLSVRFSADNLRQAGYFAMRRRCLRLPKNERKAFVEIFDELISSYLLSNNRAVAVLGGTLLEMLLARHIFLHLKNKQEAPAQKSRRIFDLNLNDLIDCCGKNGLLSARLLKLAQITRSQRNFIHPGKAFREGASLSPAGARLCLLTVLETMDEIL